MAMAACSKQVTPPPEEDALYRLECVYQTCPEDPMLILDTLNVEVLSAREQAHWCLMKAVLITDGKKYGPTFDSLLQVAKDQYIGSNDKYHETMTYWLIANKTTNLQQPQQIALDALLKARKSIESCRHVDHRLVDFSPEPTDEKTIIEKLKYFIYLELGMTYGASVYIADAIPPLKLADAYFAQTGDHYNRMSSAYMLGLAYLGIQEFDSCLVHYQDGLRAAQALGRANDCANFHHELAFYYTYCVEQNHYQTEEERQQLLDNAIREAKEGIAGLTDTAAYSYGYDKQLLLETLASTFFLMKQYDSCIYYGEQAIVVANSNDRLFENYNHYKYLYESYKALGDEKNAVVYAEHLLTMEHPETHMKDMVAVQEEFNKQEELQQQEEVHHQKSVRLYVVLTVLLAALLILALFIYFYRRSKEAETTRLREAQQQLQAELEQLTVQQKEILQQQARAICQSGQKDRLQRIIEVFEAAYPHAMEKLGVACPELNRSERNLIVLSFLGLRIKEEADLLGLSENTVMKYRSNLKNRAGLELISALLD
jgi:predicted transcriptional regulator